MKTGIVRRVDDLGRIVIPKEIRKSLRIGEGEAMEIETTREGKVVLSKYVEVDDEQADEDGSPVRAVKVAEPKKITLYVDTVNCKAYKTIEEIIPTMLDNGDIDSMEEWLCQNYTASAIHEMILEQGFDNYKQVIDEDYADYCHGCALELIECYRYTDYIQLEVEI